MSTSDIYEWAVGGSHIVHLAYGFAGDRPGGGTEIIRHDPATGAYRCHFFDDTGDLILQTLTVEDDRWTWTGGQRRCRAVMNADATELLAEHEATTDDGATWFPTATVALHRGA